MKTVDRTLCEAVGKNRRAIEKLEKKIRNSMSFHRERGTEDFPKWEAMAEKLLGLKASDKAATQALKDYRLKRKTNNATGEK